MYSGNNRSRPRGQAFTAILIGLMFCLDRADVNARGGILTASFQGLGDLPTDEFGSWAEDVSADGSVVVGHSQVDNGLEAFRWTEATGMIGLGSLPAVVPFTEGNGVSPDGSVVVGRSTSTLSSAEAFRWTESDGMMGLGLPAAGANAYAYAASQNGDVVVGHTVSNCPSCIGEAFLWTAVTGLVGLGDLPGGAFSSSATDISADGSVIVGTSRSEFGTGCSGCEAFRWTAGTGMVGLGRLPGGTASWGYAVSQDGTTVVGLSNSATSEGIGFRWTAATGMVPIAEFFFPFDVSANGRVLVGMLGGDAVIWDEANGIRNIFDVLVYGFGLDLTGWDLTDAVGVSADGRTIVGQGKNPLGQFEAWRVVLSCLPCQQHGDVYPVGSPPGDCVVDIDDILFVLSAFQDADPCVNFPSANLVPCGQTCGDGAVDVDDILSVLGAFMGIFDCPHPCPGN